MSNEQLSRLTPEEVHGPDMTELLSIPFDELCALCHEDEALAGSKFCGVCLGGER